MPIDFISVAALEEEGDAGDAARCCFCEALHSRSFALLRLSENDARLLERLRPLAEAFFDQTSEQKAAIGGFRQVGTTYAGYRDHRDCDTEFLELHVTTAGATVPELTQPVGLAEAARALHARLYALGRLLLTIIASHLGVDSAAFLAPLAPADAPPDYVSASVMRLCHYRAARHPAAGPDASVPASPPPPTEREVLFDQHTDSSMLTLSPLSTTCAGLQLADAAGGADGPWPAWVDAEDAPGATAADLEVHTGDFLSFLTRDYFPPCLHRILRPVGGVGRLSMPLLLRCAADHELDTRPYARREPSSGQQGGAPHSRLVDVRGVRCGDLGKLFDVRGKRTLDLAREREAAETARRERAMAYLERFRQKQLEGQLLSPVIFSDDEGAGGRAADRVDEAMNAAVFAACNM